jgi:hypothetical protein
MKTALILPLPLNLHGRGVEVGIPIIILEQGGKVLVQTMEKYIGPAWE